MSRLKIVSTIVTAIFLGGCGAPATPTIDAVDVQNTAVAAAFTLVAETQAALPTVTPLPPTDIPTQTPLPTNTPLTLPTSSTPATFTPLAANTAATGNDPCLTRVLSWSPKGREAKIRIVNTTRADITVSIYLNETPDHFECGYRVYNIAGRGDVIISDLVQGCYNVWAFNNDQRTPVNAFGFGCINNSDKWTFEIHQDSVKNL